MDAGARELAKTVLRLEEELEAVELEASHLRDRVAVLEEEATTDPLTGLLNRRGGVRALERMEQRACRNGSRLAAVLLDVDYFKRVNDELGHAFGDAALRAVAESVRCRLRGTDAAIRWGGEEVLVLTETDRAGALALAERLRRGIRTEVFAGGRNLSASFGVAQHAGGGWAPMVAEADAALYRAKEGGRDRVKQAPR